MTDQKYTERIARKTALECSEVERVIELFVVGLIGELLRHGVACIRGIGCFELRHVAARRHSGQLMPPSKRIVFMTRPVSGFRCAELLQQVAGVSRDTARTCIRELAASFRSASSAREEFRLDGLGSFILRDGRYRFEPDHALEELFNQGYAHLPPVDVG
ncbi:HU family DNA-binding protein [Prosthecochloris sp. N3]|uniref:HU family DNA-binding protein n=1 Tax=Prosthecochloris ethylica TaxID=2743976 RepID=A0ABR9XNK9_9CHLB|nr:HU family DNA-binding protein [Prosthecochloris ethylica]MBF0585688.1 HU family DNA-binding protein [Prosthecochloris ethylica]MBF0635598.1 HU family DNA-binding protein [Prosthecochloris ethylica]MEC9487356.1 HU family DNA-binding protein [Prosthecochloris sp.]NUK46897.1 HU family DNA-binding protein [Prosthecochloris ethylica]